VKRIRRGRPRIWRPAEVPTAIVIVAAVAAAALRAAARRPKPWGLPGAEPAPVTAAAADEQPHSAATADMHRIAGQETAKPPGTPDRPDGASEQMRSVFHELHADGHHALCEVCGHSRGA
jgi:hypothetical protein